MDAHDWLAIVTVFVLLLLSAFFAGSETALTASSRARMARRFPCFSSRAMLAREEAVSAVSLPAKNADSSSNTNTVMIASQSWASISLDSDPLSLNQRDRLSGSRVKFVGEEGAHLGRTDVILDEGRSDAAHQDKGELAALHFLVLRDQVHQRVDARHAAGDIFQLGGQTDRRKMSARPRGVRFTDQALAGAEFAFRQLFDHRGVGDHRDRLMEGADQVLAVAGIDAGLAADR